MSQFRYKHFCYHISVWRSVTPCYLVDINQHLGETCSLFSIPPRTCKLKVPLENYLPNTRRHFSVDTNITFTADRSSKLTIYVLCLQNCTQSTKGIAVLAGCLLLTLLFLAKFYFSEESINTQILSELEAEPIPGEVHIIFLETRCVLNVSVTEKQSGLFITQRQACAVSSTANSNPDSKVYLL